MTINQRRPDTLPWVFCMLLTEFTVFYYSQFINLLLKAGLDIQIVPLEWNFIFEWVNKTPLLIFIIKTKTFERIIDNRRSDSSKIVFMVPASQYLTTSAFSLLWVVCIHSMTCFCLAEYREGGEVYVVTTTRWHQVKMSCSSCKEASSSWLRENEKSCWEDQNVKKLKQPLNNGQQDVRLLGHQALRN